MDSNFQTDYLDQQEQNVSSCNFMSNEINNEIEGVALLELSGAQEQKIWIFFNVMN